MLDEAQAAAGLLHPNIITIFDVGEENDRFFIVIEATDPKFSDAETRRLLEQAGSKHVEEVHD